MVQCFNGSMVQWFNGSMVQWFNGSMFQWWFSGSVVQWFYCLWLDPHSSVSQFHQVHKKSSKISPCMNISIMMASFQSNEEILGHQKTRHILYRIWDQCDSKTRVFRWINLGENKAINLQDAKTAFTYSVIDLQISTSTSFFCCKYLLQGAPSLENF